MTSLDSSEVATALHDAYIDPLSDIEQVCQGVVIKGWRESGWLASKRRYWFELLISPGEVLRRDDPANIGPAPLADVEYDSETMIWTLSWVTGAHAEIRSTETVADLKHEQGKNSPWTK